MIQTLSKLMILLTLTSVLGCRIEPISHGPTSRPATRPSGTTTQALVVEVRAEKEALARVLKAAVSQGKVDYELLRRVRSDLDSYLAFIKDFDFAKLKTKNEKLAFYANAYNAHVLALVRDRKKLVSVVKEKGFFDQLKVKVAGSSTTLNDLESKARALGDPRIHFIVNCASGSCPILENKPFDADTLEQRLKEATTRYLDDTTHGMSIDTKNKIVHLSNIFNWYGKDFAATGKPQDVLNWITKQLSASKRKQLSDGEFQVKWKEYDWQLNSK